MASALPEKWLIDEPVTILRQDGTALETAIRVGFPYGPDLEGNYESWCWVHVDELVEIPGPMIGSSTLGVLMDALRMLADEVQTVTTNGGRFVDSNGDDAGLAEILAPLMGPSR